MQHPSLGCAGIHLLRHFCKLHQHPAHISWLPGTSAVAYCDCRTQQCFAVKGGVDGFLDIARQNFCRVTEQVHQLANQYRTEHNLPNMRVSASPSMDHNF